MISDIFSEWSLVQTDLSITRKDKNQEARGKTGYPFHCAQTPVSIKQHKWRGIRKPTEELQVRPVDESCLTLPLEGCAGKPGGEWGSCTCFKTSENCFISDVIIINQIVFASPVFEALGQQWFCEKPLEVWARKGCGRSSVMRPPADWREYSVLWVSSTGKCASSKEGFFIGEFWRLQQYLN